MNVGDTVEIIDASYRYPWKRELVGQTGTIDEVSKDAAALRMNFGEGAFPVWFAKDCLSVMPGEES